MLSNYTFSQVHRSKQAFSHKPQIIPVLASFLLCGTGLSYTALHIFLKVVLTYPLLVMANCISMAVFLLKAITHIGTGTLIAKHPGEGERDTCRLVSMGVWLH